MTSRKIDYWGENAEAAYGATGAKGDLGERFVANYLQSMGYHVTLHSEQDKQRAGFDITFKKPTDEILYGADVKNNLRDDNTFFVECAPNGWLFNPEKQSKLIWHCNPDTGWMAWYNRSRMQRHITENQFCGLAPISKWMKLRFIEWKRAGL